MFVFVLHDGAGERMAQTIRLYRHYCAIAPEEASTIAARGVVPLHTEIFPVEVYHRPFVLFGGLFAYPIEEGPLALQPLVDFGAPLIDFSGVKPYVAAQRAPDADYPDSMRYYWKSLNLVRLDDAAIDRIAALARQQPSIADTTRAGL